MDNSLTYGSHLWGSIKAIEDQSDESRAFLKRLSTFVKDKADLDHSYAKSLRKLVDKLHIEDTPSDGKTLEMFLSSFKEVVQAIATSFDQASQKAEENVIKPLQLYQEQHKKQGKSLEDEVSKTQKTHGQHQDALLAAQAACRKACDELLKAKENPNQVLSPTTTTSSSPTPTTPSLPSTSSSSSSAEPDAFDALSSIETPKKRGFNLFKRDTSHLFKSMQTQMQTVTHTIHTTAKPDLPALIDKALNADTKYINAVKSMRSYRPQHDQQLAHLLDSYQQLEEERRGHVVDTMASYLSLHSALFSGNVQVVKDVSAVLGKVSAQKDLQIFIRENRSEGKMPPLPVYEMMKGHPQYVEGFDELKERTGEEDESAAADDGVVRRKTNKEAEEERTYQRIMAEQVLTLFVDKLTGRAEDLKEREQYRKANPDAEETPEGGEVLADDKSRELDEEEMKVARRLFQTAEGRTAFATVINLQRNRGQLHLSSTAFERVAKLVLLFLDLAREAMHVAPIQLVMILSQSLWKDADPTSSPSSSSPSNPLSPSTSSSSLSSSRAPPKKLFLSTLINRHSVWTDDRFWEESFFDAFRSKLTEDQVRVHKWHSDSEQQESLHARKQAAFATLSTFAMNMKEFGMAKSEISRFVEKHAHLNDLEPEQVEMLRMMDSLPEGAVGEREGEGETQGAGGGEGVDGEKSSEEGAGAGERSQGGE